MKVSRVFYVLLFLLSINNISAQYFPYFQNYSLGAYNAGNQNWDVSRSDNGKLYVANNNGLLEYDRLKWGFFELPNKTTIRSVSAIGDKVYTGSYEEFGYWSYNPKGELKYKSLNDLLGQTESTAEEFWQIMSYKDAVVFRSFLKLYILKNGEITQIKPKSTVISISNVDDTLYVATLRNGIYTLNDKYELIPFLNAPVLYDKKMVSVSKLDDQLFIATALGGCYLYNGNNLIPYNREVNPLLKEHQLNKFSKLNNGNLVFGTIKNGIFVSDSTGKIVYNINKEDGLANNTVLGLTVADDRIWLGLDNGLTSIDLNSHQWFYNDVSGELGAVYDVIRYRDIVYIGSNTGLFYIDENGDLQFIDGSQGQVWDLTVVDGELFCGHNNGTYKVRNRRLELISPYTGGWTIKKASESQNKYIQGTYAGLVKFEKENGNWKASHMGKTTIPVQFLVFEDQYTAWAAHAYKGLYRVKFDRNHDSIVSIKNYEDKGLSSSYNVRVYNLKNNICFKVNSGWQKYEPLLDSIVPYDYLNKNLGKDSYIISEDISDQLAVKGNTGGIKFSSFSGDTNGFSLGKKYIENRLIVGYEKVSKINNSTHALNLNNGFMFINSDGYTQSAIVDVPKVEKLILNKELQEIRNIDVVNMSFRDSLNVLVSSAKSEDFFFEYKLLNGQDHQVNWHEVSGNKIEISELNPGSYTLQIRTKNTQGITSELKKLEIDVSPPWYLDTLGVVLYVAIAVVIIGIFYMLHKRKIRKEQDLLQKKFVEEQEELLKEKALENEKKIMKLKNEALSREVKLKSKQLANTAMALVKKNQTLQELKKELHDNKEDFNNRFSFKKLVKKVDYSIAHDDEWEIFEYNFNQVHEEFFNKLKEFHPDISQKDLKLCAYIKMGLSTKEIAPLMNISIRGVETHRYRLKKRLNLDNSSSLVNYLRNLN
ncbi:LuxR C-terminal-related transcriptional regulator [Galbibacter sp. EGI 63066]|uniref:helix-turn-helix and ligand-binding sensor domain-containing protein n=1 Tax=Galbibacter sp. EGI 63066 TaxID=2993559 RepID=UPI002248EBE0|nr:LuxR C-terminal-related transcriptional regulator [Galbibacter sp. EGI 63066]MCX2679304.1 LuxR C-terminal-related transcriptional regulator [Galbibacter sp. EGI 63066]